ncbi:hypothetical protein MRB53_011827 [Persea americana]|uniref:Uncharacterized protein n=1 Tax=Persea americana TaxID=3435 RepID=A0ACC2LVY6_PERAE|nr:hypothetical protein MRB53_011827 [Persea americana]
MVYCTRCRLCLAMRIVNMVVTCFGVGMIIYSLWLLKRWREAVAELGSASVLPRPWFIYTCLGVGIIVCLSTLVGHMVVNRISITALSYYILSTTSILLLQAILIVLIFFKMKWEFNFGDKFTNFLSLHLTVCRLSGITILLVQAHVLVLAVVLWALRPVSRSHCNGPSTPEFRYSFLVVGPDSRKLKQVSYVKSP